MLSKLRSWYGDWEKEQLDVLERPELAWRMAPGWRRCCAIKLARLSLIERRQLHAFSLKYRGRRLTAAIATWLLAFSAIGLVFHLLHPAKAGAHVPIMIANALGVAMVCVSVSALFGYRQMVDKGFRKAARIFLLSMGGALLGVATVAMMQGKPLIEAFQTAARDGLPIAALNLGTLTSRYVQRREELLLLLRTTADELSRVLGFGQKRTVEVKVDSGTTGLHNDR